MCHDLMPWCSSVHQYVCSERRTELVMFSDYSRFAAGSLVLAVFDSCLNSAI